MSRAVVLFRQRVAAFPAAGAKNIVHGSRLTNHGCGYFAGVRKVSLLPAIADTVALAFLG